MLLLVLLQREEESVGYNIGGVHIHALVYEIDIYVGSVVRESRRARRFFDICIISNRAMQVCVCVM